MCLTDNWTKLCNKVYFIARTMTSEPQFCDHLSLTNNVLWQMKWLWRDRRYHIYFTAQSQGEHCYIPEQRNGWVRTSSFFYCNQICIGHQDVRILWCRSTVLPLCLQVNLLSVRNSSFAFLNAKIKVQRFHFQTK